MFLFRISKVTEKYRTISSKDANWFLFSDRASGKAQMCSLSETSDRAAWFQLYPREEENICDCISITGEDFTERSIEFEREIHYV